MKNWFRLLLPLILVAVPIVGQVVYISQFAVNVPFWDQWDFIPLLQAVAQKDTGQVAALLWKPHNEHRILFPRLIFLALSRISSWNVVVEMYGSLLLASLSLVGLGLIYRKTCKGSLWGFIPISWLAFSLGQWENILWGWQLQFYLQILAVIWAVFFLSADSLRSTGLAALCGILASFSLSGGLLIWPVGLLCLAALRVEKKRLILWGVVGLLVIIAYFVGYVSPGHHPSLLSALSRPLASVEFLLANFGAPLGGGNFDLAAVIGIYLSILVLVFLYIVLRPTTRVTAPLSSSDIILGSLVLFGVLSSVVIMIGRVGFNQSYAMNSRYVTTTSVGIVGIYMLFLRRRFPGAGQSAFQDRLASALFPALISVLIIGLAVANIYGIHMGQALYASRLKMKYTLQTFESQPDSALAGLFISPKIVREGAEFLKENRLSVFSEPINLLLPTSSKEAPVGEILPDHTVVQSFRCSVQTLYDVEIRFATYARNNTSHLEIALAEGDKLLVQQSLSSAQIKDNSWVPVVLPGPIRDCKGRGLVLRVSSQDASPGNAVTIWTYPRYYEGDLSEPKEESLAGQVIGLEMNASFYRLVR